MRSVVVVALCVLVLALSAFPIVATAKPVQLGHSVGGSGDEYIFAVKSDSRGNIYLAGSTWFGSPSDYSAYIAKFSANGTLVWDRIIAVADYSYFADLDVNIAGDVYALGWSSQSGFVVKLDSAGDLVWANNMLNFTGPYVLNIAVDHSTNGAVLSGSAFWNGPVMALYPNGTVNWCAWPLSGDSVPSGIANDATGNTFVLMTYNDVKDVGVVKLDTHGNVIAATTFSAPDDIEVGNDIATTADGGVVLVGTTFHENCLLVSKLDGDLNPVWEEYVTNPDYLMDAYSLASSPDGSVYILMDSSNFTSGQYVDLLAHIGQTGVIVDAWAFPEQSFDNYLGGQWDIACLPTGGVVAAGCIKGLPFDEIQSLSNLDVIPANDSWADDAPVWSVHEESLWDAQPTVVDPAFGVDVFSSLLGLQAWFGVIDAQSSLGVSIVYDMPQPGQTSMDLTAVVVGGTGPYAFTWSFGDGMFAYEQDVTHNYPSFGTYFVQVYVQDSSGIGTGNSTYVLVDGPPVINSLTYVPYQFYMPVIEGIPIDFTVVAEDPDGGALTFLWDLGDGNTSLTTSNTIQHRFQVLGNYTVTVVVTDDEGGVSSAAVNITIAANIPPTVEFHYGPSYPHPEETVTFYTYSSDPDDWVESYSWDFGDNTTGSESAIEHAYVVEGVYNVTVIATDTGGKTGSYSAGVQVKDNWQPFADFAYSPYPPSVNSSTTFDGHQSWDVEGPVRAWNWDFGDGTYGSGEYAQHVYETGGNFNVTLTVEDGQGESGNKTLAIYVNHAPTSRFTFWPEDPLPFTAVGFDGSGSDDFDGNITQAIWTFRDGGLWQYRGLLVNYSYTQGGDFCVNLTVIDDSGGIGYCEHWIHVDVRPVANTGPDRTVPEDAPMEFNGSASFDDCGIVAYNWTIVELGFALYGETCSYTFYEPGAYTVLLTVTDTRGQVSWPDILLVIVVDVTGPTASAGPNITCTAGDIVELNGSGSWDNVGIVNYTWTFVNDGQLIIMYGPVQEFVFNTSGVYNITLTTWDAAGNNASDEMTVTVEVPVAEFPSVLIPIGGTTIILILLITATGRRTRPRREGCRCVSENPSKKSR